MQPRILFLTLLNDVGSDRIVAAMQRLGCHCGVVGERAAFAARSRHAEIVFPLPKAGGPWRRSLFLGARLERIVRRWKPDLIIPLDDFSARTLRGLGLRRKPTSALGRLIERSLGAPSAYPVVCSRERVVALASKLGLHTPLQAAVASLDAARQAAATFGYPVVLKREQTCGGFGVTIVEDEAELSIAFRHAHRKAVLKRVSQTILGLAAADQSTLVLQKFVPGAMAFRVVACMDGRILDGISFLADRINPPVTGASTVLRPIDRRDMADAARTLIADLRCSGLVSLDFVLSDEGACLIELNPRPVTSGHLGRLYGHDLYGALIDHLNGRTALRLVGLQDGPKAVALFPRELDRDPHRQLVEDADTLHDIPWDDPDLLGLYAGWLEARHPVETSNLRESILAESAARGRTDTIASDPENAGLRQRKFSLPSS